MSGKFYKTLAVDAIKPGTMQCVTVAGRPILIANVDGELLAVDDLCPHEEVSLSTGSFHGDTLKCPLHNSRFSLRTGKVLEDPCEEDLTVYAVRIEDGFIHVQV